MTINEAVEQLLLEIVNMDNVPDVNINSVRDALKSKNPMASLEDLFSEIYPNVKFRMLGNSSVANIEADYDPDNNLITIIIGGFPKDYSGKAPGIIASLHHELVHFKQRQKSEKSGLHYKTYDFNYISYVLQHLEIGAYAYQMAKKWYGFSEISFESVIKYFLPDFMNTIKKEWPSLNKNQKIWIKKQLSKFKRQYYNQIAKLQGIK